MTSPGSPSATRVPLCSTTIRSARERTTSILCSTSRYGAVAPRLDLLDQVQDRRHLVDAHPGGRLVEHEHLGLQRHQERNLELALVAVRQRLRRERAPVREAHLLEDGLRFLDEIAAVAP